MRKNALGADVKGVYTALCGIPARCIDGYILIFDGRHFTLFLSSSVALVF